MSNSMSDSKIRKEEETANEPMFTSVAQKRVCT